MKTPMNNELELIIPDAVKEAASQLAFPQDKALALFKPFAELFGVALDLLNQEAAATTAADAGTLRKKMVKARTSIRDVKDQRKADMIAAGRVIDFYHNASTAKLSEAEARLKAIEEAEERAEKARIQALKEARSKELSDLGVDPQFYPLGTMPEEGWQQLLGAQKTAHAARLAEEARKAEEARIANEKAEAERIERERLAAEESARKESERLAAMAESNRLAAELARIEAAAKAEREAAELARKEAERIAREEQVKRDAEIIAERARVKAEADRVAAAEKAERDRLEEQARLAREEAARLAKIEADRLAAELEAKRQVEIAAKKAAQAPDKDKLIAFAASVEALAVPEVTTESAQAVRAEVANKVRSFANWIRTQSANL
jgi:fused signal recognition particle receptor